MHQSGGEILVDVLRAQGCTRVFCVPGESFLATIDALYAQREQIDLLVCRHEAAAANMAEAYGKLTGQPGIVMVTRSPGACHAAIGVHTAMQDSTPMILIIGQVARPHRDREAFQEVDYRLMFGPLAKWVAQIDDAARIPEYLSHAYHLAVSGRPGPVVLAIPEDVLTELAPQPSRLPRYQRVAATPSQGQLEQMAELLGQAERPVLIVGGRGWNEQACQQLQQFAERWQLPVACAFRYQDCFDHRHPNYIGDIGFGINPALRQLVQQSDLILAFGPRLGEATTGGYSLLDIPLPQQTLIHVHSGVEELGRVYAADLLIQAGMPELASVLDQLQPESKPLWGERTAAARAAWCSWHAPSPNAGPLQLADVMQLLRQALPDDAIVCNGAGNYALWLHRFFEYRHAQTQLAPTSGAMGYGLPAAIAAKSIYPKRTVVALAGDGCFLMAGQELATAVRHGLAIVVLIINNGHYGTIRMHQERHYPARVHGTELVNPDFVAYARSFGAWAARVEQTSQFAPALAQALRQTVPAVLELVVPQEASTPSQSLSAVRQAAQQINHQ